MQLVSDWACIPGALPTPPFPVPGFHDQTGHPEVYDWLFVWQFVWYFVFSAIPSFCSQHIHLNGKETVLPKRSKYHHPLLQPCTPIYVIHYPLENQGKMNHIFFLQIGALNW